MDYESIPDLLRGLRGDDLSQRAAAKLCGVDQRTWNRWERGHREPPIGTLRRVALKLGRVLVLAAGEK